MTEANPYDEAIGAVLKAAVKKGDSLKRLNPGDIDLRENVRQSIDTESEDFQTLLESIRSRGILQPVLVEEREKDGVLSYVCVEGHRRITAAKMLGLPGVAALVKRYVDAKARTADALSADIKEFLPPLDKADAYAKLAQEKTVEQIATALGRNPRTIERYITMATWPPAAKQLIRENADLFPAHYLLHSLVQKGLKGPEVVAAVTKRLNTASLPKQNEPTSKFAKELLAEAANNGYAATVRMDGSATVLTLKLTQQQVRELTIRLRG